MVKSGYCSNLFLILTFNPSFHQKTPIFCDYCITLQIIFTADLFLICKIMMIMG